MTFYVIVINLAMLLYGTGVGVAFVIRFTKTLEANILKKVILEYCGTNRLKECWRFQNTKFMIEVQVASIVGFIFKSDCVLKSIFDFKLTINSYSSKIWIVLSLA
jgi:hypothetical protein